MRHIKLIVQQDDDLGESGLVIKGLPVVDGELMITMEGRLIAHDLIEHVNGIKAIGSIGDELEAFGASWFVRGQYGDYSRVGASCYSPEETLSMDITNLATKYLIGGEGFGIATKRTKKLNDYTEESFKEILALAKVETHNELTYIDADLVAGDIERSIEEFFLHALGFLRTGWRKAVRRSGDSGGSMNALFWNIAEAVDVALKRTGELCPGQEFILIYDSKLTNHSHAECRELYGY